MAEDLYLLIRDHLGIKDKVHVVGHDIGGMIAFAYASRHSDSVASVIWGECSRTDLDHYALAFEQPGAIRAGLEVYRAFEQDAEENRTWLKEHGKMEVPTLLLMGGKFLLAESAQSMADEIHVGAEVSVIEDSGHYIAEETPQAFVDGVLGFVGKH